MCPHVLLCERLSVCVRACVGVSTTTVGRVKVQQRAAAGEDKSIKTDTAETRSHVCIIASIL